MIDTISFSSLLLALLGWTLNTWLFLTLLRLLLHPVTAVRSNEKYRSLQRLTDDIPQYVASWITKHQSIRPAAWVPWAIVIVAVLLIEKVLRLLS